MFAVYDTYRKALHCDRHGHVKLYENAKAARRVAQKFNRSVFPKIDRMAIIEVEPRLDIVWGKPNCIIV